MDKPTPEDIAIPSDAEVIFGSPEAAPEPNGSPPPSHWLQMSSLWERRALVRRAFLYSLVAGTIIAFLLPTRYTSSTRIMPPDEQGSAAMMAAMMGKAENAGMGALARSIMGGKTTAAMYVALLRTRTVQDRIVERFELQKEYWKRYREDAIDKLDSRTTIEEDRKSGIITISVSDGNRQRARELATAYVNELNRLLADVSTSAARRERIFIEQRLTGVQKDLHEAEKEFSQFASKHSMLDINEQAKAMVESAAVLQGQLIAAESQLRGLEQIYTPENVRVRTARAQVAELRRQLQAVGGTSSDNAAGSSDTGPELYPPIRKLPLLGVTWVDLYRRAKVQETVFELLTKQYELSRIDEAKEIATVKVADPANLPERKSFPPRLLIISLVTLAGVLGAVAWIGISPHWEKLPEEDARKRIVRDLQGQLATMWSRRKSFRRSKHKDNGFEQS